MSVCITMVTVIIHALILMVATFVSVMMDMTLMIMATNATLTPTAATTVHVILMDIY